MNKITHTIVVSSAKGGVGKSTIAANLALASRANGHSVGILDADIYGPSQPHMLGVEDAPTQSPENKLQPVPAHDILSMSIGYLVDKDTPMIWRGPMVSQALQQLYNETQWGELDYLVIDMPPGTGDIQLTLAQKIPVSGVVMVTTPQTIAVLDAVKGANMFKKVNIPVLGVIENMSHFHCPACGHESAIFSEGGGQVMADNQDLFFLGAVPLDPAIRHHADGGCPTVVAEPDGTHAKCFKDIASAIHESLKAKRNSSSSKYKTKIPGVRVEQA